MDSGFQHSGFRIPKRVGFHFFPGFNAFLRTSFSCSNLAILKDVVRRHNKFVFFFGLQNCGKKCITVPQGFMVYGGGHWGTAYTATPQKKITNTALPQKNVAKHPHRNLKFCPTINLIEISL